MKWFLVMLLFLVSCHAWFWNKADDTFYTETECTYRNVDGNMDSTTFSRQDIWNCFTFIADTNKDDILALDEIEQARQDHLTKTERFFGPSAQGVINRCREQKGHHSISKSNYFDTKKTECLGDKKDICRVLSVCRRELETEDGKN